VVFSALILRLASRFTGYSVLRCDVISPEASSQWPEELMNTKQIFAHRRSERERIEIAIAALPALEVNVPSRANSRKAPSAARKKSRGGILLRVSQSSDCGLINHFTVTSGTA
jgi:hypothetical protein